MTLYRYYKDPLELVSRFQDLVDNRDDYPGADLFLQMFERVFRMV